MPDKFILHSEFQPTGDQPQAIDKLVRGIEDGDRAQTLLGVTGSGKTFTMANVIARLNRPTLVLAHNKTLAASSWRIDPPGSAMYETPLASARRRVAKHRADIPLAADGAVAEQCVAGGIFRHGQNIAADSRRQPGVKLCRYAVARRDKLTAKCFFIRHAVTVR